MNKKHHYASCLSFCAMSLFFSQITLAQNPLKEIVLTDLSFANNTGKNWQIVKEVQADLNRPNFLKTEKGTGVLINLFDERKPGKDLFFDFQHGDIDIELDYMLAKSSNSGIYLQGRYEVQLMDSWGITNYGSSDNGGVYERWDESKPQGQQGFEGYSPRQNVSRAPGLWQRLKISFQAPRFNTEGRKIQNARILLVELNGVRIQEDVELSGPTRGSIDSLENALGPLRLQGDHGAVAFKNIRYSRFDQPRPVLTDLKYSVYKGKFDEEPDYKKLKPEAEGVSTILSSGVSQLQNEFLIRYTGNLEISQAGEYSFNVGVPGGTGLMKIAGNTVVPLAEWKSTGKTTLQAGIVPFEVYYSKTVDWAKPALGLSIAGPGIREFLISDANISSNELIDPILINPATENMVLRSFTDLDGGKRVTHAINVGSIKQVHYTYDADNGMIVQLWRGGFLDATPMWHDRGDGSSVAAGSVHRFGNPSPQLQKLASLQLPWAADTTGSGFRARGYALNKEGIPTFRYKIYGADVSDMSTVIENGEGIHRTIETKNIVENLYVRLLSANFINELGNGRYLVDDHSYYLQIDDAKIVKPIIRDVGGKKELIVPVQKKVSYSIIF